MNLYIQRIADDYDNTAPPLRKALSFKDAQKLHQCCGVYLLFLSKLKALAPASQFPEMEAALMSQFKTGMLDPDLNFIIEQQVPASADLCSVSAFRPGKKWGESKTQGSKSNMETT